MSVQFALSLIDQTSRPAMAAASALARVENKLKALQAATGIDLSKLFKGDTTKQRDELGRFVGGTGGMFESMSGGALSATAAVGGLAAALGIAATAGFALAAAGASYAAEMAGFRGQAEFAFKYITGSQEKAGEVLRMADELARAMGARTTDITESIRELMAGGFDTAQAKAITAAVADVRAMNPKANIEAIATQLAQMKGAGRVLAEDLKPLLNAGINDDIFYQVLREMTGQQDQTKLKKMMEGGKVSSEMGINAILETVRSMGGGDALGSVAAAKATQSVAGAVDNAKAMFERLFIAINSGAAGGALIKIANMAANLFDPASISGQRLLAMLDRVAKFAGDMLESIDVGAIITGVLMLSDAFGMAVEAVRPLGEGLFAGLSEAGRMVMQVVQAATAGGNAADGNQRLAEALRMVGMAAGYVIVGLATVGGMAAWLAAQVARVAAFIGAAAGAIGVAIVDGIGGGLDSAWQGLVDRLGKLTSLLPDTVRSVLGIKSPSRVMMELGGYTAEGFNAGLQKAQQPSDLMAAMVEPPKAPVIAAPAPAFSAAALAARPSGATAAPTITQYITVDASNRADADDIAKATAAASEEMLVRVFERMALESGAGALAP